MDSSIAPAPSETLADSPLQLGLFGMHEEGTLEAANESLEALDGWLNTVTSKSRFKFWRNKAEYQRAEQERVAGYFQVKEKLDRVLEIF